MGIGRKEMEKKKGEKGGVVERNRDGWGKGGRKRWRGTEGGGKSRRRGRQVVEIQEG
jgi:hypothetical protein